MAENLFRGRGARGADKDRPVIVRSLGSMALLLFLLASTACSKHTATPDGSDPTTATDNVAPAISDANPPEECVDRGKAAADIATQRDHGKKLPEVLADIDKSALGASDKAIHEDMARQLYTDPFASKLSADNAANNFQGSCVADLKSKSSNIRNITNEADIERALALFKTYSGQPLLDLLGSNGVSVTALQVAPASAMNNGNYKADDTVYTLTVGSSAHDDIPCHLQQWLKGDITPTPEFVQRGPAFPLIRPSDDDPLIYWAATGKCSTAFNN